MLIAGTIKRKVFGDAHKDDAGSTSSKAPRSIAEVLTREQHDGVIGCHDDRPPLTPRVDTGLAHATGHKRGGSSTRAPKTDNLRLAREAVDAPSDAFHPRRIRDCRPRLSGPARTAAGSGDRGTGRRESACVPAGVLHHLPLAAAEVARLGSGGARHARSHPPSRTTRRPGSWSSGRCGLVSCRRPA